MMNNKRWLISLFLFLLTACGKTSSQNGRDLEGGETPPTEPAVIQPGSQMPLPGTADPADLPEEMIVIDENGLTTDQMKLVELARESLSIKFGYTLDEISFFSITPIDWPDASLGCTQPGMDYAQVITPGYQILFQAGLTAYTFHTDTNDRVVLCLEKAPDDIFIQP